MSFVVMFVAAWITVIIFYRMNKGLSLAENVFVYLITVLIGMNIYWFIGEEFKLIEVTKDGISYAGYILYKTVTVPVLYVMMMNAVFRFRSTAAALISSGVVLVIILSLNGVLLFYKTLVYTQWNLLLDAAQIVLVQAVSYGLLKLYRRALNGGVNLS
jgi:hypothetical protein